MKFLNSKASKASKVASGVISGLVSVSMISVFSLSLMGCEDGQMTNQGIGTVGGGVFGGLIGSQFGGGTGALVGTGVGVLVGALAGSGY